MAFMFTEAQERWIGALEAGQFEQCTEYLQVGDRYCCLGLACALFSQELGLASHDSDLLGCRYYDEEKSELPEKVQRHLGLRSPIGRARDRTAHEDLSTLNDMGASFAEIARLLRSHPDQYFES